VAQRHQGLLERVRALKPEPPFWGYRPDLGVPAGRGAAAGKQETGLALAAGASPLGPAEREVEGQTPPDRPYTKTHQAQRVVGHRDDQGLRRGYWLGRHCRGPCLVYQLAWYTKMIVGDDVGTQCRAPPWLAALEMAVNRPFPAGARGQALSLMRDHGCQPTSTAFLQACGTLGIQQALYQRSQPVGECGHRTGHAHAQRRVSLAAGMDLSL
jgi:putative transposase